MPKLVATSGETAGLKGEFEIPPGGSTVGRSDQCTIWVNDESISRLHAILKYSGGKLKVRDEGSSNGVFVNGERVVEAGLSDGDELKLGSVTFRVRLEQRPASSRSSVRRRQVLGGITLTAGQQTIIKIACALVCVLSIIGVIWIVSNKKKPRIRVPERPAPPRERMIRPLDEARELAREGRRLARDSRAAEDEGNTQAAFEKYKEAERKMERARELYAGLCEKYQGEGYKYIHAEATDIRAQLWTISSQRYRVQMQLLRAESGR